MYSWGEGGVRGDSSNDFAIAEQLDESPLTLTLSL
jgi:hypothetical protein